MDGRTDGRTDRQTDRQTDRKSLCLTKHDAVKTYGGTEAWFHAVLTSALDGGGEWSVSRPCHFTDGKH
jgi:hypothetical protein